MANYLQELSPEAKLGVVFNDLSKRARGMILETKALREKDKSTGKLMIPGSILTLEEINDRRRKSNHITCTVKAGEQDILAATKVVTPNGDYVNRVVALGGYSITQHDSGLIAVEVSRSIRHTAPKDPFGTTEENAGILLEDLADEDRRRVETVGSNVLRCIDAIETMALGGSAQEALAA